MAEVVHDVEQEFWRPPTVLEPEVESPLPPIPPEMAEACEECGTEFLIGARFCHACGRRRPVLSGSGTDANVMAGRWSEAVTALRTHASSLRVRSHTAWSKFSFPGWIQYLHFHEIKRWIGLPTAPLVAFMIGLGCLTGAIAVSLFYKASTLAEFQAIQLWRIQWLLAATASFVAGILLKKPSRD